MMKNLIDNRYTLEELLAVAVCKELKNGELAFIGMGTGGKSAILAVGVPTVASRLAQLTHAPDFDYMFGPIFNTDIENPPITCRDYAGWRCQSTIPTDWCLNAFKRGDVDIGFVSAAQIDKYGNTNTVCIGDYKKPKVRLVGCIAHSDHCAYSGRTIVLMRHQKRVFVEKVDFISGVGYLDGSPDARKKAGVTVGGGPSIVVTDLAIMDFNPTTHRMRLRSVHPDVTVQDVIDNTGFELEIPENVPVTAAPTEEELLLIRRIIDPEHMWLNSVMSGEYISLRD